MERIIKTDPAVFAVGGDYQIMAATTRPSLFWVKVGDECYYDDSNGILRSAVGMHRVSLPREALNEAKAYTVCVRAIIERKPYFTETEDVTEYAYTFRPVPEGGARCYQIADAHNMIKEPVQAAEEFVKAHGAIDFLILNGDVPDHSGRLENFDNIYEIVGQITHGEIPTVFSRGNHDTRGIYAENIADYTPCENGNSFFTFRLGDVWGIVLDCGEDKSDDHAEYGHTVCCHAFRLRETRFLEKVIANAKEEYAAPGVKHRIVVVHNPFTWVHHEPFDIEPELYTKWLELLKTHVKPELMLCGHLHTMKIGQPGDETDWLGHPCTVAVGSLPKKGENPSYAGMGAEFAADADVVYFNNSKGEELETYTHKLS
ncbi:MAG: metallophosphoesterase [Clostridia bacterium]|nr:metallophosphoesterase [Clostridia bacterium]